MGGFNGSDPTPSLAQFKQLVATCKVHYVLVGGSGFGGGTVPGSTPGGGFPGGFPGGARGSFPRPPGAGTGTGGFRPGGGAGGFPGGGASGFPGGGAGAPAGRGSQSTDASAIDTWVTAHGTKVSYGSTAGGMLYSVASSAAT